MRTASSSTSLRRTPSAASRMMIPGVQNPHWLAPVSVNASAHRSRSTGSIPSRVVTSRPATRRTGVTQATRAGAVDPHRAAPALALGAAPVLRGPLPQPVPQGLEERDAVVGHLDRLAVDAEPHQGRPGRRRRRCRQLNEEPHPQVREALGFEMWNPAP